MDIIRSAATVGSAPRGCQLSTQSEPELSSPLKGPVRRGARTGRGDSAKVTGVVESSGADAALLDSRG